jgi:hypothetical protein
MQINATVFFPCVTILENEAREWNPALRGQGRTVKHDVDVTWLLLSRDERAADVDGPREALPF